MTSKLGAAGGVAPRVPASRCEHPHAIPKPDPGAPQAYREQGPLDSRPDGSHLSPVVRADLDKLDAAQAAEIRRVADAK